MRVVQQSAQKLYVSQPSVSDLVHGLEEELHITIFQRTPSGVVVTNEGRELLKLGNKLLRSRPHAFIPCWRVTPSTTSPAAR